MQTSDVWDLKLSDEGPILPSVTFIGTFFLMISLGDIQKIERAWWLGKWLQEKIFLPHTTRKIWIHISNSYMESHILPQAPEAPGLRRGKEERILETANCCWVLPSRSILNWWTPTSVRHWRKWGQYLKWQEDTGQPPLASAHTYAHIHT
jgi:hypothetical protein